MRRLDFASPGFSDLAGIGQIVGHIKDALFQVIQLFTNKKQRSLENDRAQLEIDTQRVQLARELVGLARDLGYSETEVRKAAAWAETRLGKLETPIKEGMIRFIELLPDEPSQE